MKHYERLAVSLIRKAIHARGARHAWLSREERLLLAMTRRAAQAADDGQRSAADWLPPRLRSIKQMRVRDEVGARMCHQCWWCGAEENGLGDCRHGNFLKPDVLAASQLSET